MLMLFPGTKHHVHVGAAAVARPPENRPIAKRKGGDRDCRQPVRFAGTGPKQFAPRAREILARHAAARQLDLVGRTRDQWAAPDVLECIGTPQPRFRNENGDDVGGTVGPGSGLYLAYYVPRKRRRPGRCAGQPDRTAVLKSRR